MTTPKNAVEKSTSANEKKLSKPDQAALDAANTKPKNDGSHIEAEREKLLKQAEETKGKK